MKIINKICTGFLVLLFLWVFSVGFFSFAQGTSIDGKCGLANTMSTSDFPSDYLCEYGLPSDFDKLAIDGKYKRSCKGENGGVSAYCFTWKIYNDSPIVTMGFVDGLSYKIPSIYVMWGWGKNENIIFEFLSGNVYMKAIVPMTVSGKRKSLYITNLSGNTKYFIPYDVSVNDCRTYRSGKVAVSQRKLFYAWCGGCDTFNGQYVSGEVVYAYSNYSDTDCDKIKKGFKCENDSWIGFDGSNPDDYPYLSCNKNCEDFRVGFSGNLLPHGTVMTGYSDYISFDCSILSRGFLCDNGVWNGVGSTGVYKYPGCFDQKMFSGYCGVASGTFTLSYPKEGLCSGGIDIAVDTGGFDGEYNWKCSGVSSGVFVYCSSPKAFTGYSGYVCVFTGGITSWIASGDKSPFVSDTGNYYFGSGIYTTYPIDEGYNCYKPVDGKCGSLYACLSGSLMNTGESVNEYTWDCDGLYYGNQVSCNECKIGYVGADCHAGLCSGSIPNNGEFNTGLQLSGYSWSYDSKPGVCKYKCKTGYHTEDFGITCVSNTGFELAMCEGAPEIGFGTRRYWNTVGIIVQIRIRNGSGRTNWLPSTGSIKSLVPSDIECRYNCHEGWTGDKCDLPIIDGRCSSADLGEAFTYPADLCITGTVLNNDTLGYDGYYDWECEGINGGNNVNCSATKMYYEYICKLSGGNMIWDPTGMKGSIRSYVGDYYMGSGIYASFPVNDGYKCYNPVDGVCGSRYFCSEGFSSNTGEYENKYIWMCKGLYYGETVSCLECKINYTGANCDINLVIDTGFCGGSKSDNSIENTGIQMSGYVWQYSDIPGVCKYKCEPGYHYEDGPGGSCISNTGIKITNCLGAPLVGFGTRWYWNEVNIITQISIWDGSSWGSWGPSSRATKNSIPSKTECRYNCHEGWTGDKCDLPIVDGECGTNLENIVDYSYINLCSAGNPIDEDNLGDDGYYNRKCLGINGGKDISCDVVRDFFMYVCRLSGGNLIWEPNGSFSQNKSPVGNYYVGSGIYASTPINDLYKCYRPVDGLCGVKYTCLSGGVSNTGESDNKYTWTCEGLYYGNDVLCNECKGGYQLPNCDICIPSCPTGCESDNGCGSSCDKNPPSLGYSSSCIYLSSFGKWTLNSLDVYNLTKNATDNCTPYNGLIISTEPKSFNCSSLGNISINVTLKDLAGNIGNGIGTLFVADMIAPKISCNTYTTNLDSFRQAFVVPGFVADWSDNCSVTNVSMEKQIFTCDDIGSNLVGVVAKDKSGNASGCIATVIVTDNSGYCNP